jgi:asparagine synthase (glutamine-hydrolysing)
MAEYVLNLSMSFDGTPYKGIHKLPPGHCLRITREGHALRQYHRLDGETTLRLKRSEDYVAAYRESLERAIKRQLRSAYGMGTELSGNGNTSTRPGREPLWPTPTSFPGMMLLRKSSKPIGSGP